MNRLLIIDDDADFTFGLSTLLARAGHEVVVAHGGTEALAEVRARCFDVAFLDLHLPDTDGLTLLARLGEADPLLPIICLTGSHDTNAVVKAMRSGAVDYLTKPVDRQTLVNALAAATEYSAARRAGAEALPGWTACVGESPAWKRALALVSAAAAAPRTTVLLTGEPGVGKEVAAALLHRLSKRSDAPMVCANAACFSPALVESELFGHESGAFTGATRRRRGLFEQAAGGVLFLDEIGELSLDLQSKLLRVLEGHPFRRVGGEEPVSCDVRLVCATNRELPEQVKRGLFRADLLERLRIFEVHLPPLRERTEDIPHLAHHFVVKLGQELGRAASGVSPEAMDALQRHSWPGNVRELRNVIERALVLAGSKPITLQHLPVELRSPGSPPGAPLPEAAPGACGAQNVRLDEVARRHILAIFQETGSNVTRSAERLGMSRLALRKRLQAYGLKPVRS